MSKSLVEITGFAELQTKLKKLSDDKSKRKAVNKILGQVANPTVKVARQLAPVSKKAHVQKRKNGGLKKKRFIYLLHCVP